MMNELIERAHSLMKQHHMRSTKQRQLIIERLVQDPDRYINIMEVDRFLRKTYPGVSHDTIYRNMKEFEDCGIVELRADGDQMQVKYRCDVNHHHHFICDVCGKVQEIQMPPLDQQFFAQQLPGAKITGHSFELHGICADCRKKQESK